LKKSTGKGAQLILALDVASGGEALDLATPLMPDVNFFKVGLALFCAEGPVVIESIKRLGGAVFLDLKLHDIPAQVRQACRAVGTYGVDMLTVHCLGGAEMLRAAKAGVMEGARMAGVEPPLVVGVTILTSLDAGDLEGLGVNNQVQREVAMLAAVAQDSGLDGVVASPHEIKLIRAESENGFLIVTPGIRPSWSATPGDQKRVLTPRQAVESGADFLVVGRPITEARDPRTAARKILEEIDLGR
jgi:orotidine-5'-phosphate decarboxylase